MTKNGRLFLMVQFADGFIDWQEVDPETLTELKSATLPLCLVTGTHKRIKKFLLCSERTGK